MKLLSTIYSIGKFGFQCDNWVNNSRGVGTLLEEGIISMGLSQKVKGVFNHKGWFQWTFNFMLRKIIWMKILAFKLLLYSL